MSRKCREVQFVEIGFEVSRATKRLLCVGVSWDFVKITFFNSRFGADYTGDPAELAEV